MLFITGDTHRTELESLRAFCAERPELTKDDYVIIAGDFSGVWAEDTLEEDLKRFSDLPFTVLFIDGNHENFNLLNAYPVEEWQGGTVHKIKPDIIHLMRGQVFTIAGRKIFTFGGADTIIKDRLVENVSWWRGEFPTEAEFQEGIENLRKHNNAVDFVVTHSCGARALQFPAVQAIPGLWKEYKETKMLTHFEQTVSFRHWYFGHFHIDAELSESYTALYHAVKRLA